MYRSAYCMHTYQDMHCKPLRKCSLSTYATCTNSYCRTNSCAKIQGYHAQCMHPCQDMRIWAHNFWHHAQKLHTYCMHGPCHTPWSWTPRPHYTHACWRICEHTRVSSAVWSHTHTCIEVCNVHAFVSVHQHTHAGITYMYCGNQFSFAYICHSSYEYCISLSLFISFFMREITCVRTRL